MAYIPASGSVVAFQSQPSSMLVGASIIGLTPINIVQGNTSVTGNVSVIGTVPVTQSGSWITSIVNTIPSSVQVGASVMGTVPVTQVGTWGASVTGTVFVAGSVATVGSVTVLQGTNPWNISPTSVQLMSTSASVVTVQNYGYSSVMLMASTNSSVATAQLYGYGSVMLMASTNSSVITMQNFGYASVMLMASTNSSVIGVLSNSSVAVLQGTNPWIINAGNTSVLSINEVTRNDTVASLLGVDKTTRLQMGDSQGRVVIKPFAPEDATIISYVGSVTSTSVTLIQASVIGQRSYITDFWLANTGAAGTLVQFKDGSTSILGNGIAPSGGGESSPGIAIPIKTNPSQDLTFTGLTATSILYVTVKGWQGQ
jgi:hypothetical protein